MKKKIAVILIVSMLLSVCGFAFASDGTEENKTLPENDYRIDTVFELGILTLDENDDPRLEDGVTRLELAILAYRLMNYERRDQIPAATKVYYSDIDLYHYGAGYVQYLTEMGFINGYEDGTFRPNNNISLTECATILLRCAGYQDYLKQIDEPIVLAAKRAGLLDGAAVENSDMAVTRADAAKMIYNLLFMDYMTVNEITGQSLVYQKEESFIQAVLGFEYLDGVIDGIGGVSLYEKKIGEGFVSVSGQEYRTQNDYTEKHLGYHARVLLAQDSGEVIAIVPTNKNTVLTVEADMIAGYDNHIYQYWKSETANSVTRARVAKDADVLYNNYCTFDTTQMLPEYGNVTLIDNNKDGTYEVVMVNEWESKIVSAVSMQENLIVFENRNSNGEMDRIVLSDYETCRLYDASGNTISLSGINSGDVATVKRSAGNEFVSVWFSGKTVAGVVEQLKQKENEIVLTVSSTEYRTVPGYYSSGWDLNVGSGVELKLDIAGRAAGVFKTDASGRWRYGYVSKIDLTGKDEIAVKMLTDSGTFRTLICEEKLVLDGVTYRETAPAYAAINAAYHQFEEANGTGHTAELVTTRMVRYYLSSDDKIKKMDTPVRHGLYDTAVPEGLSEDNCFMIRAKGNMYFKNAQTNFKTVYPEYMDIPGDICTTGETKVFLLPEGDLDEANDSDYSVKTMTTSGFSEMFYYTSGYNTAVDDPECNIVAVRKAAGTTSLRLMIVEQVGQQLTDSGEVADAISGFVGGVSQSYPIKEGAAISVQEIKRGDVIAYEQDGGSILIRELLYRRGGDGLLNEEDTYHPNDGGTHFNIPYRVLRAEVARITDNYMQAVPAVQVTEMLGLPSNIVFYDFERDEMFTGTVYDLRTTQAYGEQADLLFVSTRSGTVSEAVALRNYQ